MEQIIYGVLLILGLGLLFASGYFYRDSKNLLSKGIRTTAEVVANNPVRDTQDGSIMYEPLMQYTADGQTHTMTGNIRSNPPRYKIGEKVNIVYDRDNAGNTKIISYWGLYLASIIMMIFAVPLIVVCGGFFLFKAGLL